MSGSDAAAGACPAHAGIEPTNSALASNVVDNKLSFMFFSYFFDSGDMFVWSCDIIIAPPCPDGVGV